MPSPLAPFGFVPGMFNQGRPPENVPQPSAPVAPPSEQNPEVIELRRRLEELESTLSARKPAKKSRKKRPRR